MMSAWEDSTVPPCMLHMQLRLMCFAIRATASQMTKVPFLSAQPITRTQALPPPHLTTPEPSPKPSPLLTCLAMSATASQMTTVPLSSPETITRTQIQTPFPASHLLGNECHRVPDDHGPVLVPQTLTFS